MFKGTRKTAVVFVMIAVFAALALSGCMPPTGGEADGASGGAMAFLPLILIIAVFYFILIRPQNKKNKQVAEMRNALKRGDYVTTIGGFRGRVTRIKDEVITIEMGVDKVKLEIMRWGISKIEESAPPRSKPTKEEREEEEEEKEDQPKRKPKKLAAAPKKESEDEDLDDDDDDEDEDDKK